MYYKREEEILKRNKTALIIGAGPAGLAAAYSLLTETEDVKPIIIETDEQIGGLSKTINYEGNLTDIGPHRFFSKDQRVLDFWEKFLPNQGYPAKDDILLERSVSFAEGGSNPEADELSMLKRKRYSRIYYMNKFFDYPVKMNLKTILNLGLIKTVICGFSYIKSCFIKRQEKSLEDFMINRFGKVLYQIFFERYTQKVWGRHPKNISKEWGEQRIKGLSLLKTILNKFLIKKETSLIEEYIYPKLGAGQLWDEMAKKIIALGGEIHTQAEVVGLNIENNKITALKVKQNQEVIDWYGDIIISSMPVKDLILGLSTIPESIKNIAEGLPYRDYELISFLVKDFNLKNNTEWKTIGNICPDSWIYIQDRGVKVGRIYIPKNFSPYICNDLNETLIGMEYFCDKGDDFRQMSDDEVFEFASNELLKIGAIKNNCDILKSYRLKAEKAYPAYFDTYSDFDKIKEFLNSIENLYCIGRNGQHKYNNMDHSVLSGITACDVIKNSFPKDILWEVNTEKSYQETK